MMNISEKNSENLSDFMHHSIARIQRKNAPAHLTKMPTTTDIAKHAGVSQATVSRVLSGTVRVSEEVKARVLTSMRALGYKQERRRKMRNGGKLVALLIVSCNQFHDYASTCWLMMRGVEQALQVAGYSLVTAHVLSKEQIPAVVRNGAVAGLILIGHNPSEAVVDALPKVPMVWLTSRHNETDDIAVPGNEAVGRIAAEYLISHGHRHIGILNTMVSPAVDIRRQYFRFIAADAGVIVSEFVYQESSAADEAGILDLDELESRVGMLIDQFLAASPRPTGLFVPQDMQTAMVYRVLFRRGVVPGKELEIIGSDDEKGSLIGLYPRPASISIGPQAMGRRAVDQLFWRMENPSVLEPMRVMVEPRLVPGDDFSLCECSLKTPKNKV